MLILLRGKTHKLQARAGALALLCVFGWLLAGPAGAQVYSPSPWLRPDQINVLAAVDASRSEALRPAVRPRHLKGTVRNWTREEQFLRWTIRLDRPAEFEGAVLMRQIAGVNLVVTLEAAGQMIASPFVSEGPVIPTRCLVSGTLRLPAGEHQITLRLRPQTPGAFFEAHVLSVELVPPGLRDQLHREAVALRADARWMHEARYGLMVHWTARTAPRTGPRKPYADAVAAFDVESFAEQVASTGAGFVVFTTSHSDQYIPAPIKALDRVLPGRTAKRDLIADLAAALKRRNIRLILYYHLGPAEDPEWATATGLWETDARPFFENWRNIVGEIGERYGERVAGWWFDDGIFNYYYRSPDWKSLYLAARKGYAGRVVCWNSTDEPPATDFQDYQCGEEFVRDGFDVAMNRDGSFHGTLIRGGDGRIAAGAFQGMQAISTFTLDGNWFHIKEDTEPPAPKRSAEELLVLYQEMQAYGATPIINVIIFQDGTLAPRSLAVMRDFAQRVGGPNATSSSRK